MTQVVPLPAPELRRATLRASLERRRRRVQQAEPMIAEGKLVRMVGLTLEAVGCEAPVGSRCMIVGGGGAQTEAEVVGFAGERVFLMPVGDIHGLTPGARVRPLSGSRNTPVGEGLLGRVVDGSGRPLDGRGPVDCDAWMPLRGRAVNPLSRAPLEQPLDVGVRAINGLLTVARGQRMGLFAGSGVGKSVLLGMMTRYTAADVTVVGLIGERGREVNDFVQKTLGPEGMKRAVVVATPADHPPLMRLHGAMLATTIAEYFRDRGLNVLLLMDSLTRFAQAQREIGLSVGEPPTTRGYPPSVFARLPALVERAGNGAKGRGSITAFYTVLTEGDDPQDPIADAARAILDGHILLSRRVADSGLYPAIDVESSVSRVVTEIADETWRDRIRKLKRLLSAYTSNRDLIAIGAYQRGNDPTVDEALEHWPEIVEFLGQDVARAADLPSSRAALEALIQRNAAAGIPVPPGLP